MGEGAEAAAMHMGEEVEKKNKKKEMPKDSDDLEEDVKGTGLEDDKELEKELEKETSDGRMQKANTSNEVMKNAIVHVMELKSLIGSKMEKMNEMKDRGSIGQMMKTGEATMTKTKEHVAKLAAAGKKDGDQACKKGDMLMRWMCKRFTTEDFPPFPRCDDEKAKGFAPRLKTFTQDYLKRTGRE